MGLRVRMGACHGCYAMPGANTVVYDGEVCEHIAGVLMGEV